MTGITQNSNFTTMTEKDKTLPDFLYKDSDDGSIRIGYHDGSDVTKEWGEWLLQKQKAIELILTGIDKQETLDDEGWWEISTGAEWGAKKLEQIRGLFTR
jgi:hypothetical protein